MIERLGWSDKGFKVAIISVLQKTITSKHETNENLVILQKGKISTTKGWWSLNSNLNSNPKTKDRSKPRESKITERLKIRLETSESENRKQYEKSMKQRQQ